MIQELIRHDGSNPIPVETVQSTLLTAARAAPEDDRIWLGWASLAARKGRFEQARRWLDRCLERRPVDPAVWRVRLDWARATENESEVRCALAHLAPDRVTPKEVLSLRAWFAHRAGDIERERRALEELVERDRGALSAMERLAELLLRTGQAERAKQLRARRGVLEQTLDWYIANVFIANRLEHTSELARAAEAVGRQIEAHDWWELAFEQSAHAAVAKEELARLDREAISVGPLPAQVTLTGLLADLNSMVTRKSDAAGALSCGASPRFVDDAKSAGLSFTFDNGLEALHQLPETMSGGVGLLDYVGDGRLDVYLVQGGQVSP
jgi:hypothetical protein